MNRADSSPPAGRLPGRGARLLWRIARRSDLLLTLLGPRRPQIDAPVFILGCPRSGKTTLAKILAAYSNFSHQKILYRLFEVFAPADMLGETKDLENGTGMSAWPQANDDPAAALRLKRLIWSDLQVAAARRLVSESSRYSYRLGLLNALFPGASFVHVIRHGAEAAQSMAERCREGLLWGQRPGIWRQIETLAARSENCAPLLGLCQSDYERGLLYWRLTVETARADAARHLSPEQYLEVRYEHVLCDPHGACGQVARFVREEPDAAMLAGARQAVQGRPLPRGPYPASTAAIAGDLLDELGYS
jgi:hypothetical protein